VASYGGSPFLSPTLSLSISFSDVLFVCKFQLLDPPFNGVAPPIVPSLPSSNGFVPHVLPDAPCFSLATPSKLP